MRELPPLRLGLFLREEIAERQRAAPPPLGTVGVDDEVGDEVDMADRDIGDLI